MLREGDADIQALVNAWKKDRRRRMEELREEADRLADAFYQAGALQVILFGSAVDGTAGVGSDLDLVVIATGVGDMPFARRFQELLAGLSPKVPVDLWVYTPEEWEEVKKERLFVREEVLKKGMVLNGG